MHSKHSAVGNRILAIIQNTIVASSSSRAFFKRTNKMATAGDRQMRVENKSLLIAEYSFEPRRDASHFLVGRDKRNTRRYKSGK